MSLSDGPSGSSLCKDRPVATLQRDNDQILRRLDHIDNTIQALFELVRSQKSPIHTQCEVIDKVDLLLEGQVDTQSVIDEKVNLLLGGQALIMTELNISNAWLQRNPAQDSTVGLCLEDADAPSEDKCCSMEKSIFPKLPAALESVPEASADACGICERKGFDIQDSDDHSNQDCNETESSKGLKVPGAAAGPMYAASIDGSSIREEGGHDIVFSGSCLAAKCHKAADSMEFGRCAALSEGRNDVDETIQDIPSSDDGAVDLESIQDIPSSDFNVDSANDYPKDILEIVDRAKNGPCDVGTLISELLMLVAPRRFQRVVLKTGS